MLLDNNSAFLAENIKMLSTCPVCKAKYPKASSFILDDNKEANLVYLKCQNCSSSVVALLYLNGFGVNTIGLVTDLSGSDVMRIKNKKKVTADNIIDLYNKLENDSVNQIFN